MTDLFEQTVQVLVTLAMSPDAETLDDIALNREVDLLIDAYLVWAPGFPSEGLQNTTSMPERSGTSAPDTDQRANPRQGG
jgi:hypothetical protein